MPPGRASKRRKLDNGTNSHVHTNGHTTDDTITSTVESSSAVDPSKPGTDSESILSKASSTAAGARVEIGTIQNDQPRYDEDVAMSDYSETVVQSREDGSPAPRTSGRKRQVSKKLEQAQADTISLARSSPLRRSRSPEKQAPARLPHDKVPVSAKKVKPAKGRRRSGKASEQILNNEVPDSEPDDASTPALVAMSHPNGVAKDIGQPGAATADMALHLVLQPGTVHPESTQTPSEARKKPPLHATEGIDKDISMVSMPNIDLDDDFVFPHGDFLPILDVVMRKLTRRAATQLVDLDKEMAKTAALIEQTVSAGESNSMVLIGARGSGKTTLINNILAEQRTLRGDSFHIVRLNGFIHTDDKIAIREIWRQLGREMQLEDNRTVKNYADTMSTLLALLSHPSELGRDENDAISKSVVIILEEFHLFTTHPRQTLLYNLFDIAQSRKAPIAVLGLTTRFDIAEALEKRVKSRFSHRQVHLPLARTFAVFKQMCRASLLIEAQEVPPSTPLMSVRTWNGTINKLLETSKSMNHALQAAFYTTKSVPAFQTSLLLPFSTIPRTRTHSPASLIAHVDSQMTLAPSLSPPDSSLSLLQTLSTLELALLISAARLTVIHSTDGVSFVLAYDEYKSLASKARIAASASGALATGVGRVWGQTVARSAWDGLVEKGLVLHGLERGDVFRVDVSLAELGALVEGGMDVGGMARWCKEI